MFKFILISILSLNISTVLAGNVFSIEGIVDKAIKQAKIKNLAPKGSASITHSGDLKKSGITHIIHAAYGSMTRNSKTYAPSLQGLKLSINNSIKLAIKNKFKRIAVPFLGSGIFLERMNTTKKALAYEIVSVLKRHSESIDIVFVAYGAFDYKLFKDILSPDSRINLIQGSIVDFKVHKAPVIVNAANTELLFGGGLSGVIGKATGKIQEINKLNKNIITSMHH